MTVLRRLSSTLGLKRLAGGQGITTIPLNGYTRWGQVEPFKWLATELLPKALDVFVILDRDYRPEAEVLEVERAFKAAGIEAHVWRRKELESYLVTPSVIERLSGMPQNGVTSLLHEVSLSFETDVFGRLLNERFKREVSAHRHAVDVTSDFKQEFDKLWPDFKFRMDVCPPKALISALNGRLQAAKYRAVTTSGLARGHRVREIPSEMVTVLEGVEAAVSRWN